MFCPECGQRANDGTKYCTACGTGLSGGAPAAVAVVAPAGQAVHAGFWRRYAAALMDATLLALLCGPVIVYDTVTNETIYSVFTTPLIIVLYFVLSEGLMQATPGKFVAGIKVTDRAGEKIALGRAALRLVGKLIMTVTLGVGFVIAAFTGRRQALDDMVAGTLVVSRRASAADIVRAPSKAMPMSLAIGAAAVFFSTVVPVSFLVVGTGDYFFRDPSPPDGIRQQTRDMYEYYGTGDTDDANIEATPILLGGGAKGDATP